MSHYLHRDTWHEALLLMLAHLAMVSQSHAQQVIRGILDFPSPHDDILQRNVLFAIECLAEDVRLPLNLRDSLLATLARLIHNNAPQVRDAALKLYRQIAVTRHATAAVQQIKQVYEYEDTSATPGFRTWAGLNVATALLYLGERDIAHLIIWPMSNDRDLLTDTFNTVRKLRFEYWPEQAASYLRDIILSAHRSVVTADADLTQCMMGPVDAALAAKVLTPDGLKQFAGELASEVKQPEDRYSLQWIQILADAEIRTDSKPSRSETAACADLMRSDAPMHIRCLAASHLLESDDRDKAIRVLQAIADNEVGVDIKAAQALLRISALDAARWRVIRDTAWLASHYGAPQAIDSLLEIGDIAYALPAALHLLITCQVGGYRSERDDRLRAVLQVLLTHGQLSVGLAAARWLALLPGYQYRIDACEVLIEYGRLDQAIPLLQYIAYECHDATSQRAAQRLLMLKEADRVVPMLQRKLHTAAADQRYDAALSLALLGHPQLAAGDEVQRIDLKRRISGDRWRAYAEAMRQFCDAGLAALDDVKPPDEDGRIAIAIGTAALIWLQRVSFNANTVPILIPASDTCAVLHLSAALFDLRGGAIENAQHRLKTALKQSDNRCSPTVRFYVLRTLAEAADLDDVSPFVQQSTHPSWAVRWAAIRGIVGREVVSARARLLEALRDDSQSVRYAAQHALGQIVDGEVTAALVDSLEPLDDEMHTPVQDAVASHGEVALQPLLQIIRDPSDPRRLAAMRLLPLLNCDIPIADIRNAIQDADVRIRRRAAFMLRSAADPASLALLRSALHDEDESVRISMIEELCERGDINALPTIHKLLNAASETVARMVTHLAKMGPPVIPILMERLHDENARVQGASISALAELREESVVPTLIQKLEHPDYSIRAAAAHALGSLRAVSAVPFLIGTLDDTYSSVVEAAVKALGTIGDVAAIGPIKKVLRTPHHFGRAAAVDALSLFSDPEILPILVESLGDEDEHVRANAAGALTKPVFVNDAAEALLSCVADEENEVRYRAVEALGTADFVVSLDVLVTLLRDAHATVRYGAAKTLGLRRKQDASAALMGHLLDAEDHPRTAIAEALGRLGVIDAGPLLTTATLPIDFLHFDGLIERLQALIHLYPSGAVAVLTHQAHRLRWTPWLPEVLMGHAKQRLGQDESALNHFMHAVKLDSNWTTCMALAHYFLDHGDVASAASAVAQARTHEPHEQVGALAEAVIRWLQGDVTTACETIRQIGLLESSDLLYLQYDGFWGRCAIATLRSIQQQLTSTSNEQ